MPVGSAAPLLDTPNTPPLITPPGRVPARSNVELVPARNTGRTGFQASAGGGEGEGEGEGLGAGAGGGFGGGGAGEGAGCAASSVAPPQPTSKVAQLDRLNFRRSRRAFCVIAYSNMSSPALVRVWPAAIQKRRHLSARCVAQQFHLCISSFAASGKSGFWSRGRRTPRRLRAMPFDA